MIATDMPKLESPFVREEIDHEYILTKQIAPSYEWVFNDPEVRAIEKLNGTDVSILIKGDQIHSIWNRNVLIMRGGLRIGMDLTGRYIVDGVMNASEKRWVSMLPEGQWFGELVGPKINKNPYNLTQHLWVPFSTVAWEHLAYKSWGQYPKTYESISEWFKTLQPLFEPMIHAGEPYSNPNPVVEGVVFTHPDGRMAKLRRDMFDWYPGKRHKK